MTSKRAMARETAMTRARATTRETAMTRTRATTIAMVDGDNGGDSNAPYQNEDILTTTHQLAVMEMDIGNGDSDGNNHSNGDARQQSH